jgi:hypothetical protein
MAEPQRHEDGRITYVIKERCFVYSSDHYGCSVCITFARLAAHRTIP